MTRKHLEIAWLGVAVVLALLVRIGHNPNPYLIEAFVVIGGGFAVYQIWRYFRRRSDA